MTHVQQDQALQKESHGESLTYAEVFDQHLDKMCSLLEQSHIDVTTKAFEKGLIGDELCMGVIDDSLIVPDHDRTYAFLMKLYQSMKKSDDDEAGRILTSFIGILNRDPVYSSIVQDLERLRKAEDQGNPDLYAFKSCMYALTGLLQLQSVSVACYSENLIAGDVMAAATDSNFRHSHFYITKVLKEIGKKIELNPENFKVFVNEVVMPLGHTKELVKSLSSVLKVDVN